MASYIISGGKKLSGKISLSGNKNSILPCLSAALLTDEEITIRNVPRILDVEVLLEILEKLGVEIKREDGLVKIQCKEIKNIVLPQELVSKLRASILLVGPLLGRFGRVDFFHPGGDVIGRRSIETHLRGFEKLGFEFQTKDREYKGRTIKAKNPEKSIFLGEASATAVENLLLASALNPATVILKNCPEEPQVVDLCNLLIKMGVKIEGVGTSTLKIIGSKKLKGADFTIGPDYIEMGTYAIASVLTSGRIEIENISLEGLEPVTYYLGQMGIVFQKTKTGVLLFAPSIKPVSKLITNIWPGFPTDLMSAMIVLSTQAKGVSLLHDWMYESRMFFTDKLISMGANITIADPHRVLVYGPSKLYGRVMESPDIRAGMALVLAALVASDQSVINRAELIERGYEDVVGKLSLLGADIKKVD